MVLGRQGEGLCNPHTVLDGTLAGMGAGKFLIDHLIAPAPTPSLCREPWKFREGEEGPKVTQKASECFASAKPVL